MKQQGPVQDVLSRNGLKVTPQRVAVYAVLVATREHPSANVVFAAVRKQVPNISFDTVNRILADFARIGLLRVAETRAGIRRYDTVLSPHHHLHCVSCGKIRDFVHVPYDSLPLPGRAIDGFMVSNKKVVLEGLCKECVRSKHKGGSR